MTTGEHCGYEWEYGGDLLNATCPSCGSKTPAQNENDERNVPIEA